MYWGAYTYFEFINITHTLNVFLEVFIQSQVINYHKTWSIVARSLYHLSHFHSKCYISSSHILFFNNYPLSFVIIWPLPKTCNMLRFVALNEIVKFLWSKSKKVIKVYNKSIRFLCMSSLHVSDVRKQIQTLWF